MNYQIVKGNIFQQDPGDSIVVIPHIVNDIGAWGSGFVVGVTKNTGPKAENRYKKWFNNKVYDKTDGLCLESGKFALGEVQIISVNAHLIIANMVGQTGTINRPNDMSRPPIRYGALAKAMEYVEKTLNRLKKTEFPNFSDINTVIHCPKFGSERAGGDWKIIEQMILEIWVDRGIPVTVYEYEGK